MKTWWFALVLAGCVADSDKPDLDASGTVQAQMTYGGGNCAKSGSEAFTIYLAKNGYGSYDITQGAIGQSIGGNVVCGPVYCRIDFFKSWQNNDNDSLHLDGTLTLDGNDMSIKGNGKYSVFGLGTDCEQTVMYQGALR